MLNKRFLILGPIFLAVLISLLLFFKTPEAQAREYVRKVEKDLQLIQKRLIYYKGAFTALSQSSKTSKQAFYEITTSRKYFEAVEDTKQDIKDINSTLNLIAEAKQRKSKLKVPISLVYFDQQLSDYYNQTEQGMRLLLEHEEFQLKMLNASGDELNKKVQELDSIFSLPNPRKDMINLFADMTTLAELSVQEFKNIHPIPESETGFYQFLLEYHQDLLQTVKKMGQELQQANETGDTTYATTASHFSERTQSRNSQIKEASQKWIDTSQIKTLFEEVAFLEIWLTNELKVLKKIDWNKENPEAPIISPTSTATPSALPIPATTSATPATNSLGE